MPAMSVTESERAAFEEDGFVVLRGVFEPGEVKAAADEAEALLVRPELTDRKNLRVRRTWNLTQNGEVIELFDPIVDVARGCSALARDARLTSKIAALRGVPEVGLFKDKILFKSPGTVGYPLHQDFIAWPTFPESFTTVVVALDRATAESGAIEVYRRGHAKGCLAPRDGGFHMLADGVVEGLERVVLTLEPGDVAVYGCFMPHRSAPNLGSEPRRHLLVSYADGADEGGARRQQHYEDFHQWLRETYGAMGLGDLHFA
jgi:ectoine hydroxylase-related dioxygenase (phytanoyl-CoA dioxygenase family)